MQAFKLALHGGAGTILPEEMTPEKESAIRSALQQALEAGYEILFQGGRALDAVEETVRILEDSPLFNAGRGSVYTHEGTHEMDASIMCGRRLNAGAVGLVQGVRNPVALARKVLEESQHVFLCGQGATHFAREHGLSLEESAFFADEYRYQQWQEALKADRVQLDHSASDDKKYGTVGAVALDQHGDLAAATSTGGLTNKKYGRIGDSPIIGAGSYANNETCAISSTGFGEFFIRGVVAYDISCLMEYKGLSLQEACRLVIHEKQPKLGGEGGVIAVDKLGNVVLEFNSVGMYRGWIDTGNGGEVGVFR